MARMSYVHKEDVISEEGYRLAPFMLRLTATVVDAAFFVGSFILLFFLLSSSRFPTLIDALGAGDAQAELTVYQVNSGLVYRDEKNVLTDISSESYKDYENAIVYYYLNYEGGSNEYNPEPLNFSVEDYNKQILGLPESDEYVNHSPYYEYVKDGDGHSIFNQMGVIRKEFYGENDELTEEAKTSLLTFYRDAYGVAQDKLMSRPYYKHAESILNRGYIIVESIALYVPYLVFYFIIPITNVPGQTLGKKFMKLAVAESSTGVAQEKWKVSLRSLPFIVTSLFALIMNDLVVSGTLIILVLLSSSGLLVFTKKRRSLHDYIANSCVIREDDLMIKKPKKADNEGENA